MADDIKMVIGVQYDGLLKAITATDTLEGKVKKLSGAYARGSASYSKYNKAVTRLAIESNKGAKAQAEAKKELLAYGSALRKATKDEKEAKAVKAALKVAEQQRVKSLREEKVAIQQKVAADARNASELKRLRMSVDAVYSAQQKRLNMKKLLKAAVVAETMTTKQAIVALKQYNAAQMTSSKVMGMSKNKMNGNNMAIQQLGYQFGDFAVQVQGGTSAFVAFSQQGAQLAGMLPMIAGPLGLTMGAAVGLSAALGILIPVGSSIGRMFFDMGDKAKGAASDFGKVSDSLDLINSINIISFGTDFRDVAKEIKQEFQGILGVIQEVAMFDLKKNLAKPFEDLVSQIAKFQASSMVAAQSQSGPINFDILGLDKLSDATFLAAQLNTLTGETREELARQAEAIEEALELRGIESMQVNRILAGISKEIGLIATVNSLISEGVKGVEATAESTKAVYEALNNSTLEAAALAEQMDAGRSKAEAYVNLVISLEEELGEAGVNALLLAGVDITTGIDTAALAAARLAGNLSMSLQEAMNLIALSNDPLNAFGGKGEFIPKDYAPDPVRRTPSGGGGGSSSGPDPVEKLRQQIELNSQLVGLSKEEATVLTQVNAIQNSLGEDRNKYSRETVVGLIQQNEAYKEQQRVLEETKAKQDALATSIASSFGDAFTSIIDGTKSAKDAFKDMARSIIKQLLEVLVVQRLVGKVGVDGGAGSGIAGMISGWFGGASANGNVFSGGSQVQAYANGGVVNSPTNFPMSGNKVGLMGEDGAEAIMPLKRGANGKLGVQAEGVGGGDVIHISQSFNFQANGDETVKKLIAQAAPKIAQMTKSSMIDDRRRGGVTKSAFG